MKESNFLEAVKVLYNSGGGGGGRGIEWNRWEQGKVICRGSGENRGVESRNNDAKKGLQQSEVRQFG